MEPQVRAEQNNLLNYFFPKLPRREFWLMATVSESARTGLGTHATSSLGNVG